jgi:AGZA family xanthine/uracil permease-like MFS transporter
LALDIAGSINFVKHPEYLVPLVVFLFFDMFDTVGTMIGIGEQAGFMRNGVLPRSREVLAADAVGTIIGALFGTSTVTSYIESAAGVSEGGRTGFANIITGVMFLISLGFLLMVMHWGPGIVENAPQTLSHITAPALIVVGVLMMSNVTKIEWARFDEAIPAMLVIMLMPLSYRISMGLATGFVSWPLIKLLKGEGREVSWILYVLASLIVVGFIAVEI